MEIESCRILGNIECKTNEQSIEHGIKTWKPSNCLCKLYKLFILNVGFH